MSSDVNKHFKKVILLSAASYFEHRVQEILINFIAHKTNGDIPVLNFFKKKAIGMQYHTYFSWGEKNRPDKPGKSANSFFALFGEDFKKDAVRKIKESPELTNSMQAFLEIGHLRNILVHSNFAAYEFNNKTTDGVVELYKDGIDFVAFIEELLLGNFAKDREMMENETV